MAGKADIVDKVADTVEGLTKKQVAEVFDAIFDAITGCLENGDRVQLPKFGSFAISKRAARKGRNPATGNSITIAASRSVRFKQGKDLKDAVNS
jgi:DNA-binding protein HU-beta